MNPGAGEELKHLMAGVKSKTSKPEGLDINDKALDIKPKVSGPKSLDLKDKGLDSKAKGLNPKAGKSRQSGYFLAYLFTWLQTTNSQSEPSYYPLPRQFPSRPTSPLISL